MEMDAVAEIGEEVIINESSQEVHLHPILYGKKLEKLPEDLYIPPDALQVFLEAFEGPLDLLLYLIRKHNVNILDIPIADITHQYIEYVELMKDLRLELAADYLVMAAMLAEIKSRMLLPRPKEDILIEEDPRAQLIRRLQEYERFKNAAEALNNLPFVGKDTFIGRAQMGEMPVKALIPQVTMQELVAAFYDILKRTDLTQRHKISKEGLNVRERMSSILHKLQQNSFLAFEACFDVSEGRLGIVVSFLAIFRVT